MSTPKVFNTLFLYFYILKVKLFYFGNALFEKFDNVLLQKYAFNFICIFNYSDLLLLHMRNDL